MSTCTFGTLAILELFGCHKIHSGGKVWTAVTIHTDL